MNISRNGAKTTFLHISQQYKTEISSPLHIHVTSVQQLNPHHIHVTSVQQLNPLHIHVTSVQQLHPYHIHITSVQQLNVLIYTICVSSRLSYLAEAIPDMCYSKLEWTRMIVTPLVNIRTVKHISQSITLVAHI